MLVSSSQPLGDIPVLPPLSVKSSELRTIKTELAQIKSNIDALLGRLEQIAEAQKSNPGQLPRVPAQISGQGHRAECGEDSAWGREGLWPPIPPGPTVLRPRLR